METYNGHVRTPNDAIILFEACRLGLLPRVQRRLSEKERQSIRSGSVFVWDEREAGMRRWTDGKSWSASRVSGSFLTYREMEGKRGGNNFVTPVNGQQSRTNESPRSGSNGMDDGLDGEEGPDGYRYKPDGLMKQSFSLTTSTGQHLHLISYFSRAQPTAQVLRQPSNDPTLSQIQIPKGMYPESTVADASNTPAVTRSPMPGAPNYVLAQGNAFARSPAPPGYVPGYIPHPGFVYPLSPMHTPPGHFPYPYPYAMPGPYHPGAYAVPPPHLPLHHAPPSSFDQRPLRNSMPLPRSPTRTTQSMPQVVPPYPQDSSRPPYPQDTNRPPVPTTQATYPITPGSERSSSVQIDPRLTENGAPPPQSAPPTTNNSGAPNLSPRHEAHLYNPASTQGPSITSLVNAAAQATPLPPKSTITTTVTETEGDRQGSVSPGGTRYGAPPQDIPSEKLAFREDKMALSKLDRVFARV